MNTSKFGEKVRKSLKTFNLIKYILSYISDSVDYIIQQKNHAAGEVAYLIVCANGSTQKNEQLIDYGCIYWGHFLTLGGLSILNR